MASYRLKFGSIKYGILPFEVRFLGSKIRL